MKKFTLVSFAVIASMSACPVMAQPGGDMQLPPSASKKKIGCYPEINLENGYPYPVCTPYFAVSQSAILSNKGDKTISVTKEFKSVVTKIPRQKVKPKD